jgi:hypothetical protein
MKFYDIWEIRIYLAIFSNIYKNNIWNNGDSNVPLSEPGSSIENTQEVAKLLNNFVYEYQCTKIMDLGCGDLTWISRTPFFQDQNIQYTGVDVVEHLINGHQQKYPTRNFLCQDLVYYKNIPKVSLIIIRDVIFHLRKNEVYQIFQNMRNCFDYIALTSCQNAENIDHFNQWKYSQLNIHILPYNINRNPIKSIYEPVFDRNFYIYSHEEFYRNFHDSS